MRKRKLETAAKIKKKRIVVVDDHPIVRRGIAELLDDTDNLTACGQAGTVEEALRLVSKKRPDLALVDLFLDGIMATELIKDLSAKFPDMKILVFSIQKEALFAERALKAGADGYLVKEEATHEVLHAIQTLLDDKIYLSGKIGEKIFFDLGEEEEGGRRDFIKKLSDRELQVFELLGGGASIRGIAERLSVSPKTVETHCARIKRKLRLQTGSDLNRLALQWHTESLGRARQGLGA